MIINPYTFSSAAEGPGAGLIEDLVAWWDFEENTSGTQFLDARGSHHLNIINSGTSAGRSVSGGRKGRASSWPDAAHSDGAQIPRSDTAFDANGNFTLGAWFYFNEMPSDDLTRFLIGRLGGTGASQICYAIQLRTAASQQQISFIVRNAADNANFAASQSIGGPLQINTWYFAVLSMDTGVMNRYVNTTKQDTSYTDGVQSGGNSNFSVAQGRRDDTTDWDNSRTVSMRVDSAFYMNRAITDAEVALLYNGGAGMSYADLLATA